MGFNMFGQNEDEDELNIAGQPPMSAPLPVGVQQPDAPVPSMNDEMGSPDLPVEKPTEYAIQNALVRDHMSKLLGKYTDENRQKQVEDNENDAKGPNVLAALASLGSGLSGGDAAAAGQNYLKAQQVRRDAKLTEFDKGRAGVLENSKFSRELRDDATNQAKLGREMDVNSEESKLAQDLAGRMVKGRDFSKMSAQQINGLLPGITKIYDIEQKKIERRDQLQAKADAKRGGGTEGQVAADKDYAKDYNDWTSVGSSSVAKNLTALREARDALSKDSSLTGGLTGVLPDRVTADRVLQQRQKVGSAIQASLKATLGSAFTEKEGERILKNAYNEAASPKANIASLDALINQLESQAANNDAKAKHFEKTGSLRGYAGIAPKTSTKTVRLKAPDGSVRDVPEGDAEKYLQKGATRV